jgi:hypothetical protein
MNGIDPTGSLLSTAKQADAAVAANGSKWTSFDVSTEQKRLARQNSWEELIDGEWVHNGAKCFATATAFTTAGATAAAVGLRDTATDIHAVLEQNGNMLIAALTPLNAMRYQLIYPEDLTSIGISGSTTYNGTAIQMEVNYRPDFALATAVGDQINQIGDVSGAYNMLDMFAYDTYAGLGNFNSDNYDTTCTDANETPGDVLCNQDGDTISAAVAARFVTDDDAMSNIFASYIAPLEGFAQTPTGTGLFLTAVATGAAGDGYEFVNDDGALAFQTYLGSLNSGNGLAHAAGAFNKAIQDGAYSAGLVDAELGTAEDAATDATLTGSGYVGAVNNAAAVAGAYWGGLMNFNRSSLGAIAQADTLNDYYSTPFIKYDVWTVDIGTTSSFNASHPVTQGLGADSSALLTEWGFVTIPDLDNVKNGYVARNGFQAGIGADKCLGGYGALLGGATPFTFGGATGLTHLGAGMADGLFGNGKYCESNNGASSTAMTYRVIGTATYNNLQNTSWSMSPRFVWSHDPMGWAPTSVGGFNEGRASLSLGLGFAKAGGISVDLNYVNQIGDEFENSQNDKDYISASVSYAF